MSSPVLENLTLDELIRKMYDNMVQDLKRKNILTEREYYTENRNYIPFGDMLDGTSYYDQFEEMKAEIKEPNISEYQIKLIFETMESLFLFSRGHDMMFKHKLNGDCFCSVPIESIIYPRLQKTVKSRFNDVSVMVENPKLEENISEIWRLIYNYQEFSSLLFMLYAHDWQFSNGWKQFFSESYDFLLKELQETDLTIGTFLYELVGYKCKMMEEVLQCIDNLTLRQKYLDKLTKLKQDKQEEIASYASKELSVSFFLKHTVEDFIHREPESSIPSTKKRTPTDSK